MTLVYIALIASSTTVFLVQYAAMRLPSSKVMAYTYLTPTAGCLIWELALGQPVPPVLVLAGVVLSFGALALLSEGLSGIKVAAPAGLADWAATRGGDADACRHKQGTISSP
jgi:drug/metabolite transporter (DMT)-like permease